MLRMHMSIADTRVPFLCTWQQERQGLAGIATLYPASGFGRSRTWLVPALAQAGVNPLAGCLPTLATIPIFIGLYSSLTNAASEGLFDTQASHGPV